MTEDEKILQEEFQKRWKRSPQPVQRLHCPVSGADPFRPGFSF